MHLIIAANDSEPDLRLELAQAFPGAEVEQDKPALLATDFPLGPGRRWPYLVFARQVLPNASLTKADSIRGWARAIFECAVETVPEDRPWALHIEPHYGNQATHRIGARAWHTAGHHRGQPARSREPHAGPTADAGKNRSVLIREALLQILKEKRRQLLRHLSLDDGPFGLTTSLFQVLLTAPDTGFISWAPGPIPYEQRHLISRFPKGEVPLASDKTAPSRAFAKLVEAELRLGRTIRAGETCIDLGASPGSWTYVAVQQGARVIAVDRSPLRIDLMRSQQVEFREGDAFGFEPSGPVDWLLCDVIASPERSAELLLKWLRHRWCRHFVVTIKLKESSSGNVLATLKHELPALTSELYLTKLCANKKEVCAFGRAE